MKFLTLILTVVLAGCNLAIAQSPYATRLPAELQTAQMDSLADVTWLQGTTPAIRVEPLLRGRPVAVDADTTVRMVIGPSATGTLYAARTNLAGVTNAYEIQWPTIGTNSAGAAWFYTLLFDRAGFTYWSGSGKLYIEETTSTASNGLEWIEYTTPNVGAAVLRSIATVPASDAYSAAASESLPFVVTNTGALTISGLTSGSTGIRLTTTNASGVALYSAVVKDGDGETVATIHPACDGSEQSARWPWNASETLTVEASDIASTAGEAESAIITAVQVETWEDVSLVGKTNNLADQHLYVDYPAATNEAANRAYADDAADAALALALGEIATATFNRDLAGFVQRWNPRFDTVAASNSLSTLYGGSTALRLDGEGAAIVPEIRAFAVEAGEVATLTVWSYSGGASNLVPEVTTNLITGLWERKPESIVSATNVDAFTAQVVFTNDFEQLLYVRLVDVSGGTGAPVLRVFGGIAFGDGEAITDWPQGTILGATVNEPHTVATNDGILAFTVTADGSGFPLTNDVSAAGFDLQGVGWFSAQNATISNNATVNNSFSVGENAQIGGTLAVHDDMTVYGNLAVIGYSSNIQWHYINVYTQVNGGTFTNFITENRYSTNNVYLVTNIVNTTYTTQFVDYVSVVGSDVDYSLSANVMLPHLTDGTETNAVATGTWDFTGATLIGLPAQGVTNIGSSMTGNGLETALDVDWGTATTTAMTNIDWASFGDGGATNMANGTYDAGTRTLTATGYPTIAEMEAYVASNAVSATNEIPAALNDLADVDTAPADGDVLAWNSSASVWTNAAASGGGTDDGVFEPYQIPYSAEGVTLDPTNGWWQTMDIATGTSTLSFAACSTGTAYSVRLDIIGTNALTWNVADPVVAPTIATEADGTTKVLFDSPIGSDAWGAKRIW